MFVSTFLQTASILTLWIGYLALPFLLERSVHSSYFDLVQVCLQQYPLNRDFRRGIAIIPERHSKTGSIDSVSIAAQCSRASSKYLINLTGNHRSPFPRFDSQLQTQIKCGDNPRGVGGRGRDGPTGTLLTTRTPSSHPRGIVRCGF